MRKLGYLTVIAFVLTLAQQAPSLASEGPRQGVSLQGTGFFTKDSQGCGISQHSTDTGGFLVGYRYHFNAWLAAETNYGYRSEYTVKPDSIR